MEFFNTIGSEPPFAGSGTNDRVAGVDSIYDADASTLAGSQHAKLETVKNGFLIKKLGLYNGPEFEAAIQMVIEKSGRAERNKCRAVINYILTKHFGRESIYE